MGKVAEGFISIFTLMIGVAALAVIVSQKSNTVGVLNAWGNTFAKSLGAATAPITGSAVGTASPNYFPATSTLGNFGGALTIGNFGQ